MERLKNFLEKFAEKADISELFYMNNFIDALNFEANELKKITNCQNEGMGLRVNKNKKIGFSISTGIKDNIMKEALENAESGNIPGFDFAKDRVNFSPEIYMDRHIENIEIQSLIEEGEKIIREIMEFDRRIKVNINFEKKLQEVYLLTSCGFSGNYKKNYYSLSVTAKLARQNDIFIIADGFSDRKSIGREEKIVKKILSHIEQGVNTVKIDSGKYPVLFTTEALGCLFSNFIPAIKGDLVLKKISPLYSKEGEVIFDNRITICDDPTLAGVKNHIPFDDEGTVAQSTVIVEKGVLKNFLLDLEYGNKLKRASTGNGLRTSMLKERSYETYPSICHTTITVEPGNILYEDLLENIDTGLLVKDTISPFNINGDLSITVTHGYKIEKGKIKGRVKDRVISVNLFNLLEKKLLEITSDAEFTSSSEYRLPGMLFKDVDVN